MKLRCNLYAIQTAKRYVQQARANRLRGARKAGLMNQQAAATERQLAILAATVWVRPPVSYYERPPVSSDEVKIVTHYGKQVISPYASQFKNHPYNRLDEYACQDDIESIAHTLMRAKSRGEPYPFDHEDD